MFPKLTSFGPSVSNGVGWDTSDGVDQLFGWYFAGDVETPTANPEMTFRTSQASAEYLRDFERAGALVVGRRQFDVAGGWSGRHPMDVPVFVVTHEPPADWAYRMRRSRSSPKEACRAPSSRRRQSPVTRSSALARATSPARHWRPGWLTGVTHLIYRRR
jgi:hypothetical protein